MSSANEKLIRDFCAAWVRKDLDELVAYFTDDAVYHNVPVDPVQGKAAIRETFNSFVLPAEKIQWDVLEVAERGNVVFTERVDRFFIGGKEIALPVAGVFEIRDGKIAAWRDYFDLQTWMRQQG